MKWPESSFWTVSAAGVVSSRRTGRRPGLRGRAGQMWDGIEYCSGEDLLSRLEEERMDGYGTGNGDSSGNRGCGGLSEL